MKRFFAFISIAALLIALPRVALQVGGGGGGSVPIVACDSDSWTCGEWSACSSSGSQTRNCALTVDCSNVDTPRPAEERSCTPPCTADSWECSDWSGCSADGVRTRVCGRTFDCASVDTLKPEETMSCVPQIQDEPQPTPPEAPRSACTVDQWVCDAWQACDPGGNQKRMCRGTVDCPTAETRQPENIQRCQVLQCGNLATLAERVRCRLGLALAGVTREHELQYLPEECRALPLGEDQNRCVEQYRAYKPCWSIPVGDERIACARGALDMADTPQLLMVRCRTSRASETVKAQCVQEVREQTYALIKFRIYDLEERAEEFASDGADFDTVADFVVLIQTKKQEFNNAATYEARQQVILDVRAAWAAFVDDVKDQVK